MNEYIREQIIRKQEEVIVCWQNNVKEYITKRCYPDVEHDVDNFLRGYNEAVEDILAILESESKRKGVC